MALDTRDKRGSAIAAGLVLAFVFPNPDGAVDTVGDRQQVVRLYSGVTAGGGTTLTIRPRFDGQRVTPSEIPEVLTLPTFSQITTPSAPAGNSVTPASPASKLATLSEPGSAKVTPIRTSE